MKRVITALAITAMVTAGWSTIAPISGHAQETAQAGEAFFQKISRINESATNGDWQQASKETAALRSLYQKKKWKLQLLGDEGEYEGLDRELDQLAAAVATKDKTETKMELGAVRSLLQNIYSL